MQAYHQSFTAAQAAYTTPAAAAAAAAAHYYHHHQQTHHQSAAAAANYAVLQSQYLQGSGSDVAAVAGFPYANSAAATNSAAQVYAGSQVLDQRKELFNKIDANFFLKISSFFKNNKKYFNNNNRCY